MRAMLTPKFDTLVQQLKILPGVGNKTAQRMALHLLTHKRAQGMALADALLVAMSQIKQCQRCRGLSDDEICPVCADPRRSDSMLCIVETAADMMAIEQTANFNGKYFVLGGHLSPMDGIGAEQLGLDALVALLRHQYDSGEPVQEVILATSTTVEGQTTAHFVNEVVKPYVLRVTRIAQGIPMGGELGYLDAMTLGQALQNRASW